MIQVLPEDPTKNVWGRIGRGFGESLNKTLSEQLPKEVERKRLATGLKTLGEKKDITPFQQFAELSSTPGVTPQMIESGTKLLRDTARGQAAAKASETGRIQAPEVEKGQEKTSNIPSITQEEPLAKFQEGYIPPTQEQVVSNAGKKFNANPALYGNDFQNALDQEDKIVSRDQAIADAYQTKHENLTKIQDNVKNRLKEHSGNLGVDIPGNIYTKIESDAIQATKPKSQGGRGLTEHQASREYGDKLDAVSRDYSGLEAVGNIGMLGKSPSENQRVLKSLQKKFAERNDTENMADSLVGNNGLSPMTAYAIAEPVSEVPALNKKLSKIPSIERIDPSAIFLEENPEVIPKTLQLSKELAPLLGDKGSPLAVAYELQKKGYDPSIWLDYLDRNRKELNLRGNQERQLGKPESFTGTLNDWWLNSWTGLDEGAK